LLHFSSHFVRTIIAFVVVFCANCFCWGQPNQRRLALVIGNANYKFANPLKNPVNDARAIGSALQGLGFEVMEYDDVTQPQMKQAINSFGQKLKDYDVGLFYYAGHGVQSKGVNYMIPVDAELKNEETIEFDCVAADRVLAFMDAASTKVNLIIMDACRNNPFARSWQRSAGGGGLAMMDAPKGSLIAYATSPGRTASDGAASNGLYTSALLKFMRNPALTIEQVFKQVRNEVSDKSGGAQIPWETTSLTGEDFYLGKGSKVVLAQASADNSSNQTALSRSQSSIKAAKVTEEDKAQAEIFFAQGKISYDARKYDKALGEFSKALNFNPAYADAYYHRGTTYYAMENYDDAIRDYTTAIQLDPGYKEAFYWRGNSHYAVRQDDKALADYNEAIKLKPDYAQAYYWKGRTHYELTQEDAAIEQFNRAIALKPDYRDAIFWRGQAFYSKKKFDDAIVDYSQAIVLKNDDAESYYWRANARFSLKKYDQALEDFNNAVTLRATYPEAYFYRGKVKYNLARYDEALADFQKAADQKTSYAEAFYWQAVVYYHLKNYNAAIDFSSKALEINPQHADAFYYRAIARYALKQDDEAIADFDQSIALKPAADAYYWRGLSKYDQQDYADAIPDFSKSIEIDPSGATTHNYYYYRANAYYALKMDANAIKDFNQAIARKPDFAEAYYYRGLCNFYQGQKDTALADLNKALELDPSNTKYTNFKAANFK